MDNQIGWRLAGGGDALTPEQVKEKREEQILVLAAVLGIPGDETEKHNAIVPNSLELVRNRAFDFMDQWDTGLSWNQAEKYAAAYAGTLIADHSPLKEQLETKKLIALAMVVRNVMRLDPSDKQFPKIIDWIPTLLPEHLLKEARERVQGITKASGE